jgi:hypothetical protein
MASLFRQKTVVYRTLDGKTCRSDAPGAERCVVESKKWYGEYRGANGNPVRRPLSENKEIARRMLAKLAGDAVEASVGLVDPFAEHRERPLLAHLEDFRRYLVAKNSVPDHVIKTTAQCRAILDGCRFIEIEDLQPSAVIEYLAGLRQPGRLVQLEEASYTTKEVATILQIDIASVLRLEKRGQVPSSGRAPGSGRRKLFSRDVVISYLEKQTRGISIETSNHYLASIKHFSKWLMKNGRSPTDALAVLSRLNADVDIRHARRALTAEAFAALVAAARAGRAFRNLSGSDRAFLYQFASHTGLRAGELTSLTPASFLLHTEPPTVTVEAAYSKHRRKDVLPLRMDMARLTQSY